MTNYSNYNLIRAVREGNVTKASTLIATFGVSYSKAWSCGYILLRDALQRKHRNIAKALLKHGSRVNSKMKHRVNTPLHFAVKNKDAEIVAMLLDREANVDARNHLGQTPLHLSVKKSNSKIVSLLLDKKAEVNAQDNFGRTPLHCACVKNREEIVKLLLKSGANINARTNKQSTALHLAAKMMSDKIVKVLLEHDGVDIDAEDDSGKTVLNVAVDRRHLVMIETILAICPQLNNEKNQHCIRGYLCEPGNERYRSVIVKILLSHGFGVHPEDASDLGLLHIAVEEGCTEIVDDLLRYGADVDSPHVQKRGYTLLHNAAFNSRLDIAEMLIKHGADVNAIDRTGRSPTFYAIERIDAKMTKLLVSSGAKIKFNPDVLHLDVNRDAADIIKIMLNHDTDLDVMAKGMYERTALWYVVNSHNYEKIPIYCRIEQDLAELLLNRGANVNAVNEDDDSFLRTAIKRDREDMVEILLRHNADVNLVTKKDMVIPLYYSVTRKNEQISRMLLNAGASSNTEMRMGKTALHYACLVDDEKMVDTLLKFGAEIDHKDRNGSTPLHIAVGYGRRKIVETLLMSFADVECTDQIGRTALHLALKHGFPKIVKKLLDYGADPNVPCKRGHSPIDYTNPCLFHYNESPAQRFYHLRRSEFGHDTGDDYGYYYEVYSDIIDQNSFESDYCNAGETVDAIKRHIIKIKSLNIHNSKQNLESVELNREFADFQAGCEHEVRLMKSERIGETNMSYYDVFMKSINQLAIFARNQDIVEDLESSRCGERFPVYYKMLYSKFKKGEKRGNLLNPSLKFFNFLSRFSLPELPSLKVLDMLSNKDLENLIKAVPET